MSIKIRAVRSLIGAGELKKYLIWFESVHFDYKNHRLTFSPELGRMWVEEMVDRTTEFFTEWGFPTKACFRSLCLLIWYERTGALPVLMEVVSSLYALLMFTPIWLNCSSCINTPRKSVLYRIVMNTWSVVAQRLIGKPRLGVTRFTLVKENLRNSEHGRRSGFGELVERSSNFKWVGPCVWQIRAGYSARSSFLS